MSNQGMFEKDFPNYTSAHSKSSDARLAAAYPNSPIHSGVGINIEDFTRSGVKTFYQNEALNNSFPEHSDFKSGGYDYRLAPQIPADGMAAEGEAAIGKPGSTISASGLGPNVATIDLSNLGDITIVEAGLMGVTPFVGEGAGLSPKAASSRQNEELLETPGNLGSYS
jgi:hypothetical protein